MLAGKRKQEQRRGGEMKDRSMDLGERERGREEVLG